MGNADKKSSFGATKSLFAKKTPEKTVKAEEEENCPDLECCSFSEKNEPLPLFMTKDRPPPLELIETEDDGTEIKLDTRVMNTTTTTSFFFFFFLVERNEYLCSARIHQKCQ